MLARLGVLLISAALAVSLAACRAPAEEGVTLPSVTPRPLIGGPALAAPPDVDDEPPAGVCEDTVNILSRVDRDPDSLFQAVALDNRVGDENGDGIVRVRFGVVGDNLAYTKDEFEAPYCIFGGNEPNCPPWPRDASGAYTWGPDGPVVQAGQYRVFVEVLAAQPDSATGSDTCDWSFLMTIQSR